MSAFLFSLVLRAPSAVDFPFLRKSLLPATASHQTRPPLEVGRSFMQSSDDLHPVFFPAKGQHLSVLAVNTEGSDLDRVLHEPPVVRPFSFTYVHQLTPYVNHRFAFRNYPVSIYGLCSVPGHEVLVITNLTDFPSLIEAEHPNEWFVLNMANATDGSFDLNTRRVCSRWSRWCQPTSSLSSFGERFFVLTKSMVPNELRSTEWTPLQE